MTNREVRESVLVSVLLTCGARPYAVGALAIPSVLAQTHDNWELIVVSESEDNTRMKCTVAEFKDSRIRYVEVARHHGASHSRTGVHELRARALNSALELASGTVVAFLDEDSEYLPDHLQASVQALQRESVGIVYGAVAIHDRNTGHQMDDYVEPAELPGRMDGINSATVCLSRASSPNGFSEAGDHAPTHAMMAAMLEAGMRSVGLPTARVVSYGGDDTGRVRVSMPSLPAVERLHELVDAIAWSRQLSNNGPINTKLEAALRDYTGARHVVTVANGDTALGMAMIYAASQHPDRHEVVLPSYTFPSTVNASSSARADPGVLRHRARQSMRIRPPRWLP